VAGAEPRRDNAVDVDDDRPHPGLDREVVEDPRVADRHQSGGENREEGERAESKDDHAGNRPGDGDPEDRQLHIAAHHLERQPDRRLPCLGGEAGVLTIAFDPGSERTQVAEGAQEGHRDRQPGEAEGDPQHQQEVAVGRVVIEIEQRQQADRYEPRRLQLDRHEEGRVTPAQAAVEPGEDPLGYVHTRRLHRANCPRCGRTGRL